MSSRILPILEVPPLKRYLFAMVGLALLATSCSGSADVAATVNGTDIEKSTVQSMVHPSTEELSNEELVQLLDILVQWTAIAETAKNDFGIEPSADEIAAEIDRIFTAQGAGGTFDDFLVAQNISEEGLDLYAAQLLIGEEVLNELTESLAPPSVVEAQQLLTDDPYNWTTVCAAHILVATEEEATAVLDRLGGGDEFADVAIELSTDTGSGAAGGDLGCTVPSGYVEPFADATMTGEIGNVVGPVESQFGFHLIRVDSRTEATLEELQTGLADITLSEAIDEWYLASIGTAEVSVGAEYGSWETEPFPGIVPATTTPTPTLTP